jgi:hypothetical protein
MDIASPLIYHLDEIIWASSHMNPRAGLDHGEKMYGSMIFRGMVQYDWLGYEFFTGRGLHYNQDCSWWRPSSMGGKVTWLSTWLENISLEVTFLGQPETFAQLPTLQLEAFC